MIEKYIGYPFIIPIMTVIILPLVEIAEINMKCPYKMLKDYGHRGMEFPR
jgi:hypothetical protein